MNAPHVTLLFAAVGALLQVALTALVIVRRAQTGVGFLHGDDGPLLRRIRAHGNFAETAPMALLLLALLEIRGLSAPWLWAIGGALLLSRLLHAASLLTDNAAWSRRGGMSVTLAVLLVEAAWAIALFVR
jgi:hypothetical protein